MGGVTPPLRRIAECRELFTMRILGNEYNRMELAGAFGDLGTFIPFVAAYITLNKMDPLGILVAFGFFKIFVGQYFKTPFPVQPMKAIGGMAIAHPESITQGMIWGSGIFTAVFWLIMGLTGAVSWLHKITAKPIFAASCWVWGSPSSWKASG